MSVFTPVSRAQLEQFLQTFDLGKLIEFRGIDGGSENSNFFVTCETGEFVLTLVERGPADELTFFVALLECLHQAALPVPYAIPDRYGQAIGTLNGRPALLQPRLRGNHVQQPEARHCSAVGDMLARLHEVSADCGLARKTDRGAEWMKHEAALLRQHASGDTSGLLDEALQALDQFATFRQKLPQAVLHADLFRDNIMFEGDKLTGVIDFYNAASGSTLYDVAICVNDWCLDDADQLDPVRTDALLKAYAARRPFTTVEAQCWPPMLRIAALRFWLSREIAARAHAEHAGVLIKDPGHFQTILANHRRVEIALPVSS
ncbi:homoserine kinase [Pseudomonas sp. OIL-1]|uniref:homoserine kinase n=1 Tax=Pseudomonas sp. OIL-1 TaxID=2706126 RepID=UPI0013A73458|nr:homoserine kinase [Pseudomonas sp. OIL-1]QIB50375.1 homoserine kinase [Pseudomonas sp. OIL-1]